MLQEKKTGDIVFLCRWLEPSKKTGEQEKRRGKVGRGFQAFFERERQREVEV